MKFAFVQQYAGSAADWTVATICRVVGASRNGYYDVSTQGVVVPVFSETEIDFTHVYKAETSIQVAGGAAFDLDHAGAEELFLGGGEGPQDHSFRFVDITETTGYRKETDEATPSVVSLDVDGNGFDDLIVTTTTAIWLHRNHNGTFTGEKLDAPVPSDTTPLSVAAAESRRGLFFGRQIALPLRVRGTPVHPRCG